MRSLARKGFDLIIGTTFEYGTTMDALSQEFPKIYWLHVSGYPATAPIMATCSARWKI